MPRFCANLSMLFGEVDFLERFGKAAAAGFRGVECQFPYAWPKERIAEALDAHGLTMVLHNLPPGDWRAGERGIACIPGREAEFQDSVGRAIGYAKALRCTRLNCLAGIRPDGVHPQTAAETLAANLRFAAAALEAEGIRLLVEALNARDVPGFWPVHTAQALELMRKVGHPNFYLQFDVYHMQVMEGDLTRSIQTNIDRIGHIQIADNPGRNEPGTGEINFPNLFRAIDAAGYREWVGCEYVPAGGTEAGLGWVRPYLRRKGGRPEAPDGA